MQQNPHGLELEVNVWQVWERVVHVRASSQSQSVEPVIANRCLGLRYQSIKIITLASEIDENFDRDTSVFS